MALPEQPPDLDQFFSFLDAEVGGFIVPPSRGITSGFMKSTKSDKIFIDVHIRRLQRLRVAQQEAFEEAEFVHNFKAVDSRLEAEFLDSLRKAGAILESRNESIYLSVRSSTAGAAVEG